MRPGNVNSGICPGHEEPLLWKEEGEFRGRGTSWACHRMWEFSISFGATASHPLTSLKLRVRTGLRMLLLKTWFTFPLIINIKHDS
jgi:hypothetical protein